MASCIVPEVVVYSSSPEPEEQVPHVQPKLPDAAEQQDQHLTFNDLPRELQIQIFSYFLPSELCHTISLVCKEWHCRACDPSLWKKLSVSKLHSGIIGGLCRFLSHATMLRILSIRSSFCCLDEVATSSCAFPMLRYLDLGFSVGIDADFMQVIVSNCPLIQFLNLEGCETVDHQVIMSVIRLNHLKSLNLSHCVMLSDESISALASSCEHLSELNVSGITKITDSSVCLLGWKLHQNLISLELDGEELTDKSFESLRLCSHLQNFEISYAEAITDKSLPCLKAMTKLHRLKVYKVPQFTSEGLTDLFADHHFEYLREVEFDSLNLDDEGLHNLTKCCPDLQFLTLSWCWLITDVGLSAILTNSRKLKQLDLTGLFLLTGKDLLQVPTSLPNLRSLNLLQCADIYDSVLTVLASMVPSLIIFDYYGELVRSSPVASEESDEEPCGELLNVE